MATERARKMRELMKEERILNWRHIEPVPGARLQVLYPHHITEDERQVLAREIAEVEGCEPDWIEMLPRNAAVNGTDFND